MDYTLKISPRMLELLSKDLYTNLYFVLAELIANAYDADAENVYIDITDNSISVEDDGTGMDPSQLNDTYLFVGTETRNSEENARTPNKKRLKMGRKGIGKLAALSISKGFQLVTIKDGIASAIFIPNSIEHDNEVLSELSPEDYTLKHITDHGTAIIMNAPKVHIPSIKETVINNLSRIFPKEIPDFHIYATFKGNSFEIKPDEKTIIPRLATLVTIGDEYSKLKDSLDSDNANIQYEYIDEYTKEIDIANSKQEMTKLPLTIKGWIGTYRTTREMKKDINEFSDNYLAIFAHNKMGQRNILSLVGKNRVYESYVVGNLHIDAFEASDYPDMAGTNRQGYNENDPRWIAALEFIRPLIDKVVKMHSAYATLESIEKKKKKLAKQEELEKDLKKKISVASAEMSNGLAKGLENHDDITELVNRELEKMKPLFGLKSKVDTNKKKIIISQTLLDKQVSDVVYQMLLFNGVPKDAIIYSNANDPEANIPETNVYDYLRKFFVESASDEKIYVLFVTSKNVLNVEDDDKASASWGVLMEIGATWITQKDHWIFNRDGYEPRQPLNIDQKIVEIKTIDNGDGTSHLSISGACCNSFAQKIIIACQACGFTPKSFDENKQYLASFVSIFEPGLDSTD